MSTTTATTSRTSATPEPAATRGRLLLLAGPAYTALLVLAAAAFPAPPGGDETAALDAGWLADHTGAVIAQSYVRALASIAFVLLAVAVAVLARRRGAAPWVAPAALAGGALSGGLVLLSQGVALAGAQLARAGGGADAVHGLGQLQEAVLDMSSLPAVVLFVATAVVVLTTGLPPWLGWFSALGLPLGLVDAASFTGGPLSSVGLVGLVYFLVWALLTGTFLHRAAAVR